MYIRIAKKVCSIPALLRLNDSIRFSSHQSHLYNKFNSFLQREEEKQIWNRSRSALPVIDKEEKNSVFFIGTVFSTASYSD